MHRYRLRLPLALPCLIAIAAFTSSCARDSATAPATVAASDTVSLCHVTGATGQIVLVSPAAAALRKAQGDYAVAYSVTKGAVTGADSVTFSRIGDALAAVRAGRLARGELQTARCRITITVGAGVFRGDVADNSDATVERFPIMIDVPAITLQGALVMHNDSRAIPVDRSASDPAPTILSPLAPLQIIGGTSSQTGASTPLIVANTHPGGSSGSGLWIKGFVFQSGHAGVDTLAGGQGVNSMRVDSLVIQGNRFESGFTESIDLRASNALIDRNYLFGGGGTCDICVAGPGTYALTYNRLLAGAIPGMLIVPALILPVAPGIEQYVLPASSVVTAGVANNYIENHLRKPVGAGVRVGAVGVGAPNVAGTSHVTATGNILFNNNFAFIVEAAFPVANTTLSGNIDFTASGNQISQSCQADLLVSFSRHTTALGLSNQPYLKNSTFTLTMGTDLPWANAWFSHPSAQGNTLIVNGETMPNGLQAPYAASRTCDPQ